MNSQKITGNHNQQAGQNIINNFNDSEFDPNNPNIIDCPCCWKPTSKFANECPKCGYAVLAHLTRELNEAQAVQIKKALLVMCSLLFISLLLGFYFSIPYLVIFVAIPSIIYIKALEHKLNKLSQLD